MITIPSEVKAALKDGSYAKNYRFETPIERQVIVQEGVTTYWKNVEPILDGTYVDVPNETGTYRIFSSGDIESCSEYRATFDGDEFIEYEVKHDNNGTYVENVPAGATMIIYGGSGNIQKQVDSAENADTTHVIEPVYETVNDTLVIDNNHLVSESVKITERMATGDTLKFGLCEGSNLEFEYFDLPSVKDCDLRAYIDVYYGAEQPYTIPMGTYTVDEISRQASTGIKKVTAYNKLQSKYLDKKANNLAKQHFDNQDTPVMLTDIFNNMLNEYRIMPAFTNVQSHVSTTPSIAGFGFGNIPLKFSKQYGIETPLSACEINKKITLTNNTIMYLFLDLQGRRYAFNNADDYWNVIENYGRLEVLETNIFERLKYVFDSAQVTTTYNVAPFVSGEKITGDNIIEHLCKNNDAKNVFGITVTQGNTTKTYSTIQWEYEKSHNLTHTVNGTIRDFINRTGHGVATITFTYLANIEIWQNNSFENSSTGRLLIIPLVKEKSYDYWTNIAKNNIETLTLQPVKFENGTALTETTGGQWETNFQDAITVGTRNVTPIDSYSTTLDALPDYTLRDIISASYEINCQLGKLDRETDLFSGVELSQNSAVETVSKDMYSDLWYDKDNEQSWKYLIITYKGLDGNGNEAEYTLQRTINANGTQNYNCSGNWIFRNLIWTAEQVGEFADAMVAKMQGVTWFPFEMWCAGLPYLETGDKITIPVEEDDGTVTNHDTYILQRDLGGIQDLHDTYINGTLDIF